MSKLKVIIAREFLAKIRHRTFIVMTFLSPLLVVGISVVIGLLANMKPEQKTIGVLDPSELFFTHLRNDSTYTFSLITQKSEQQLKQLLKSEAIDGLLILPKKDNLLSKNTSYKYLSDDSPSVGFIERMESTLNEVVTNENRIKFGIDTLALQQSKADISLQLEKASGEKALKGINELKIAIGGAFGYLIMMFIIIYGNMVMRSVIEEKTNRIIEIIVSSVKPFDLMLGKIIGTSLAGLLQFIIWALLGGIAFFVATQWFHLPTSGQAMASQQAGLAPEGMSLVKSYFVELAQLPLATLLFGFIFYFIGGYLLFSSLYAAIGAAVDSETDSQQFLLPIIMPLVLGVYIGFFTVINDPHGSVATFFSIFPLTSPIVMLMRIPFGVPWYELALSLAVLYATFFGVVWLAARIYKVGILMYGQKPSWKDLYKWLK
ncbi:MAG: ABC transporter permease [Flavobacterium sp. BFFFF2]|nr:MAG: ABC transporter permease [Flavobacterium sp. BFFFF2]